MKADARSQLLELIKREAVRRGTFRLSSGATSSFYIDCRMVTLHPEGLHLTAEVILEKIRSSDATAIGGLTLGADPIAAAVALLSSRTSRPLRAFIVRKEAKGHGTGKRIEGPLRRGDRVVIVDDTVTTGGACFQAIEEAEKAGCKIVKVVCLVDRNGAGEAMRQKGYDYDPIFCLRDLGLS